MTETEIEMYEIEMYRCVREIHAGVLHEERRAGGAGVLGCLTALDDVCRITNQSIPAWEKEGGEKERARHSQTRLVASLQILLVCALLGVHSPTERKKTTSQWMCFHKFGFL